MSGENIVLSAKAKDGSEGLITLSPVVGDYTVQIPETLHTKPGELLTLYCPVCHRNLASTKHIHLAMVLAKDEQGKEFEIYFSQVMNEHSTITMMGDHVKLFGEHAHKYQDLFETRQMF
jgi:hypothetical protein